MTRWPKRRLGDLTDVLSGFAFDSEGFGDSGEIPVVRIRDVVPGRSSTFYRGAFDSRFIVDSGDILIGMDGEFNRARWCGGKALLNQRVSRIAPSSRDIDDGYLFYFLPAALKAIEQVTPFVTVKHLSVKQIRDIVVPLPPLPEQRRIAETLDKADALRAKRRAALVQLDTLTQSIFLDMFGDPATNPKGWPQVPIGDHASKIGSGATPRGGEESYKAAGITLIRSMNVRDGAFLRDGLAFIDDEQAAQLEGVVVEADDVLLNITGASVARVCRAPADVLPARVNQHVAIIRSTATFNSHFLEQCLLSPSVKERLLKIARAGATREAITKSAIEQFRVIRPPRELQDQFAARVVASEETYRQMRAALGEMDSFFASLQHRAFRGEL
jgi:type I restriction enzyme S subunit